MRIGTWNLEGRWSHEHVSLVESVACDVWLLTEVSNQVGLPGLVGHVTDALMAPRRHWAGIFGVDVEPLPDPHPASAMAVVKGHTFCASVLPWRTCGPEAPWQPGPLADKTAGALRALLSALPRTDLVWGGDWNHALSGPEHAGSKDGRRHLLTTLGLLNLQVPTTHLRSQGDTMLSIDHVAVPAAYDVVSAEHVSVPSRLSDHDLYVVEIQAPAR